MVARVAELGPKVGNVDVNRPRLDVARIEAPDPLEDFVPRDRAVAICREVAEQFNLAFRQFSPTSVLEPDLASVEVGTSAGNGNLAHGLGPFG